MKAYVVHTRPLPGCCKSGDVPTILEVEGEKISAMEDPSVLWLKEGEFWFRILKPESLYESTETKMPDGSKKKVMVPPVYFSAGVYPSLEEARTVAQFMVKASMDFEVRKKRIESYSEEDLQKKLAEIKEVLL